MSAAPEPFDRSLRRRRHAAAQSSFATADFLHAAMADEIRERVAAIKRDFTAVLDLGGPAPIWPGATRLALAPRAISIVADAPDVVADEDRLPFADASFDLVVSAAGLASVSDLPGALVQARRVLKPDGLFVAAFVGGMTLHEMRADLIEADIAGTGGAAARLAPMVEAQAAAALLQRAGFALPVADVDRLTVRYSSLFALFDDLTAMGARSPLSSRTPLRRDVLAEAASRFAARAAPDGKTAITVEIIHLAGWAPAPSQQVPLKPGSATNSLAKALGSKI
ncbi:SAM-dependent methyltransferase [Polymorphobacter glacialis]|uniref:SAM-dependent methyltransferase n=1 Tax=Sandarakinorhabdus glacialis TaxID=1614636 RepID=A0A917EAA7_9SPHN|nr:methyltransferase domain-containing protein [Polymorphobacter glacialis]GGE18753.1 SAM-dependent methyltransferase [Polymorphobacter glacialis]